MTQDVVFTLVGLWFMTSLLPTARGKRAAVPRATSVQTAIGLFIIAVTDWTLDLRLSAVQTLGTAGLWAYIAWRRPVRKEEA